jgi:hypothetical protein
MLKQKLQNTFFGMPFHIFLYSLFSLLAACGEGTENNSSTTQPTFREEIINGIKVPPDPDSQKNNATLKGIDLNQNGIRDDVERFIAKKWGNDPEAYSIVIPTAKAMQTLIEHYEPDVTLTRSSPKINEAMEIINDFYSCNFLLLHQGSRFSGLELIVTNTDARRKAYRRTRAGAVTGASLCKTKK